MLFRSLDTPPNLIRQCADQSVAYGVLMSLTKKCRGAVCGAEPGQVFSQGRGSGTAAARYWLRERDSNPRPPAYETGELPLLHPRIEGSFVRPHDARPEPQREDNACADESNEVGGAHAAATGEDAGTAPKRSGRKSYRLTCPSVARSMATACSAEICVAPFSSHDTPCCDSPILSAKTACEPHISTASFT